jgi:hypothetical protein
MKHLLTKTIAGSALSLFSFGAYAQQYPPRYGEDRYYSDRRDRNMFAERVQSDLDRAESTAYPSSSDASRIARARDDMSDFQRKMDVGTYDSRALTEAIVSLQRIVDNNRLYERTRESLVDDLNRLRDMRERYESGYYQ